MNYDPNQVFYDPSMMAMLPSFPPQNQMMFNQSIPMNSKPMQKTKVSKAPLADVPSLHAPAILLLAFCWLIHAIATFIPYWANYSGVHNSRAGLWSARNFDFFSIQNFYFPEPNSFSNLTNSIRFTSANTKGYLVTVQFLMTFNFVFMLIVLVLLSVDFIFAQRSPTEPHSFLIRSQNTCDTAIIYGLLLYILYVFTVFEFAAWITYVGSRHDNNWKMNASFALTVIVSVFLICVFVLYVIEFVKTFGKNRSNWNSWYGQYSEWGLFVYLTALLFLLLVICCPEWAYVKVNQYNIFGEIGLFKQCHLSVIYKKTPSPNRCTLSNSSSNQSWVNASQAFMLMAYIAGIFLLIVIVVFRKEFRHTQNGYEATKVPQPTFTYIISGLILFFCFIFTLIGISIFGGKVFHNSINVNWGFIVAVFAMVLFLVAAVLFILDAVHSRNQSIAKNASSFQNTIFPAPLNQRAALMQPLLKPEPPAPAPSVPPMLSLPPWQQMNYPQSSFNPDPNSFHPSFLPYPQAPIYPNYGMDNHPFAPITQGGLTNYFYQMQNNPQLSPIPNNQGLMNYSGDFAYPYPNQDPKDIYTDNNLNDLVRLHFVQQQRLKYNHERLLEKYSRLRTPYASEFKAFGTSSLPGRNYDQYLKEMRYNDDDDDDYNYSIAAQSRAGIGSSDETYRVMGGTSFQPLPRDASSFMQHSRNDPEPIVRAENFEPVKIYKHPIFGPTPAYLRPIYEKKKNSKSKHQEIDSDHSDIEESIKRASSITTTTLVDDEELSDSIPPGYAPLDDWKDQPNKLIPVNPVLLNIYNQRKNGSIQSYGQSLYAPSISSNHNRQENFYEDTSTLPLSDSKSTSVSNRDISKKNPYNKLRSTNSSINLSKRDNQESTTSSNSSALKESNPLELSTAADLFKPLTSTSKNSSMDLLNLSASNELNNKDVISVQKTSSLLPFNEIIPDNSTSDNEENRQIHRRAKKKSTATITNKADVILSTSSDDD